MGQQQALIGISQRLPLMFASSATIGTGPALAWVRATRAFRSYQRSA